MDSINRFLHITLADFRERTRSYSYLCTLILTIFAAYIFVWLVDIGYVPMQFGKYRSFNNIYYLWTAVIANESLFLSLIGFYLVKSSIDKDEKTTTGQIIAATPTTKVSYILGKAASNFIVLLSIVLVLAIVISIMIPFRFMDAPFSLLSLYITYIIILLPPIIFVSAAAILFETIPPLRRGLGNIIYFFIWVLVFVTIIASSATNSNTGIGMHSLFDLAGFSFFYQSMIDASQASFSVSGGAVYNMLKIGPKHAAEGFLWNGIDWTQNIILSRLFIIVLAGMLLGLASLIFNRFDSKGRNEKGIKGMIPETSHQLFPAVGKSSPLPANFKLSALSCDAKHFSFFQIVLFEIRLMLKGMSWWWFAIAAGLIAAGLINTADFSRKYFIVYLTWIWPTLLWSSMGARERLYDTSQIIFSCAFPVSRQIPGLLAAGIAVAVLTGSGLCIRLILEGDMLGLFSWFAAVVFVPALALSLGTLSGNSKLFEAVYLILWYLGPVNRIPALDFTGTAKGIDLIVQPFIYIVIAIILISVAIIKRAKQVREI